MELGILGVNLRNHQRNIRIQTECGRIVNEDSAGLHNGGSKLLCNVILSCAQNDVDTLESGIAGFLDHHILAAELEGLTRRALGCQRHQLANREVAFFQQTHHFLANGAGCAQNTNSIQFHNSYLQIFNVIVGRLLADGASQDGPVKPRDCHATQAHRLAMTVILNRMLTWSRSCCTAPEWLP